MKDIPWISITCVMQMQRSIKVLAYAVEESFPGVPKLASDQSVLFSIGLWPRSPMHGSTLCTISEKPQTTSPYFFHNRPGQLENKDTSTLIYLPGWLVLDSDLRLPKRVHILQRAVYLSLTSSFGEENPSRW
jgi:hypothetical protein